VTLKLLKKLKLNKLYALVPQQETELFSSLGFVHLKKVPAELLIFKNKLDENQSAMILTRSRENRVDASFSKKPDLILVDGGKGQLTQAVKALSEFGLNIPVIALAKQFEEIFTPGKKAPILLEQADEAIKLLAQVRDESHRFAITYHRKLHRKALLGKPARAV